MYSEKILSFGSKERTICECCIAQIQTDIRLRDFSGL